MQIAFTTNHVRPHLGMHAHRGTLTHKQGCTDADSGTQINTVHAQAHAFENTREGKYKKRQTWPNYFLPFLSSVSFLF